MKSKNNIIAIIPAYNEEKRISHVIDDICKYVTTIVVVDDGSTDNTAVIVKNKSVILVQHLLNLGAGAALQTGLDFAKTLNPDVVVSYDADGQFAPEEIPDIINPILKNKCDFVSGSRFLGKTINMPFLKFIILKIGILFTYIFSGIKLTDTHNGFRAFSKKALDTIQIHQNGMAHASEIIDQIKRYNLRAIEVPVTITYDTYSKQKGQRYSNAFNIIWHLIFHKLQ